MGFCHALKSEFHDASPARARASLVRYDPWLLLFRVSDLARFVDGFAAEADV